jgi:hypothetical protein
MACPFAAPPPSRAPPGPRPRVRPPAAVWPFPSDLLRNFYPHEGVRSERRSERRRVNGEETVYGTACRAGVCRQSRSRTAGKDISRVLCGGPRSVHYHLCPPLPLPLTSGAVPANRVSQFGGHATVDAALTRILGQPSSNRLGFSTTLDEPDVFSGRLPTSSTAVESAGGDTPFPWRCTLKTPALVVMTLAS